MSNTPNYKLEYFTRGSDYSASSDYRRFFTVDYNMETYVGIMGVGIINGWTIQQITDLNVEILPGTGIINGYSVESPYTIKKRSEMIMGDREIEVIIKDDIPEQYLTPTQKALYISIVQAYNPTYIPPANIEDSYVKTVITYKLTLTDFADNYIYVERKYSNPYPPVLDYPTVDADPPSVYDYPQYSDFLIAKTAYDLQIENLRNYSWQDNPANHFTEVNFKVQTSQFIPSSTKVLLGKVVTRNNTVYKIDTSMVQSLYQMESLIKNYVNLVIPQHTHGGSKIYDPQKINLETDIRQAILQSYDTNNKKATFKILEKEYSSITLGHKHTYSIDLNGNGVTIGQIGSEIKHFHKISNFVVQTQENTIDALESHIHTINTTYDTSFSDTSDYVLYVNNNIVGDQTSSNIEVDTTNKTVSMIGIMGGVSKTYSSSFTAYGKDYSFSSQTTSVFRFMLEMETDFTNKFPMSDTASYDTHPFIFVQSDSTLAGLDDLKTQCLVAQNFLTNEGDEFIFTPNAGRNITVKVSSYKQTFGLETYDVKIEILGNSEVTGTLSTDNILYVNASKINTGIFDIARIPFISHIGKINETLYPTQYPLSSNDGILYQVTPSNTSEALGHSHTSELNPYLTGLTNNVIVNNVPVYYATNNNIQYFISHTHNIVTGKIETANSTGLLDWQKSIDSTITTSEHAHTLIDYVIGNAKVIYCSCEDKFGNIYLGTSDGLMMIPYDDAYEFTINNTQIIEIGNNLWDAFLKAVADYEEQTGIELKSNASTYYDKIITAETELVLNDDTYYIEDKVSGNVDSDKILIKKTEYFQVPNFQYTTEKKFNEITADDELISIKIRDSVTNYELDPNSESTKELLESKNPNLVLTAIVRRQINLTPIFNIDIKTITKNGVDYENIYVVGKNVIAYNNNLQTSFYNNWEIPTVPTFAPPYRKLIRDSSNDLWLATDNGLLALRNNDVLSNNIFDIVVTPGIEKIVTDVIEGETGSIYICKGKYIYKTIDQGLNWTNIYTSIDNILHLTIDKTSLINNIWAISNEIIYSSDLGVTWTNKGFVEKEYSSYIIFNDTIYLNTVDGIYSLNGTWSKTFDKIGYSFNYSYDFQSLIIGCENVLYETFDGLIFTNVYSFEGNMSPSLLIDNTKINFGYTFSNLSGRFFFNEKLITEESVSALVDYSQWKVNDGWDTSPYDLYLNGLLIGSSKEAIPQTIPFTIDNTNGNINFGNIQTLSQEINVNDSVIVIANNSFIVGDIILIKSNKDIGTEPTNPGFTIDLPQYIIDETNYWNNKISINNMFIYAEVVYVDGNNVTILASDKKIELPATVYRVPTLNSQSQLNFSLYNSKLTNIGTNTHEELENKFSNTTDFRPYSLNNSFLSNLLQLTQAVKYVYPSIDQYIKNVFLCDFHNNFDCVDKLNSAIYSQGIFKDNFVSKKAKSVNSILIGEGTFLNKIIVGTDIGLFWANTYSNMESNWFYVFEMQYPIYDLKIINLNTLILATQNGTYLTTDMITFTLLTDENIYFPSFAMEYRWPIKDRITISDHWATFSNITTSTDTYGIIQANSNLYTSITENRAMTLTILSDPTNANNGTYTILEIYPDKLVVTPAFTDIGSIFTGGVIGDMIISDDFVISPSATNIFFIQIEVASWWELFNNQTNIGNTNITNPLIVGGENKISVNTSNDGLNWTTAKVNKNVTDFTISDFCSLENGKMLACANTDIKDYLLYTTDTGLNWNILKEFDQVKGTINSFALNDFGHTLLNVTYAYPTEYLYMNGSTSKLPISIFAENISTPIYTSNVIWNSTYSLCIYENANISTYLDAGIKLSFVIYPPKLNCVKEFNDTVYLGTSAGLYYDMDSITKNKIVSGNILSTGIRGIVTAIDINGAIISTQSNNLSNVVLSVIIDQNIFQNELKDKTLYIIDSNPIKTYKILSNTVFKDGQIEIEIDAKYNTSFIYNIGKSITVVGSTSRVYLTFSRPVANDELNGGKMYVASNENANEGVEYSIIKNSTTYIEIPSIIPGTSMSFGGNANLTVNQTVMMINSLNQLELIVDFDNIVENNEFVNNVFEPTISGSTYLNTNSITIHSNTQNKIVLHNFTLEQNIYETMKNANSFNVKGTSFHVVSEFDTQFTSQNLDHYHKNTMVNKIISGIISSITTITSSQVTFTVSNTANFNTTIVQKRGDLFKGGTIRYWNSNNLGSELFGKIISHTPTSITVEILSGNQWDSIYNENKVSVGWSWEIDGYHYGYADTIIYKDFAVINTDITQDITIGSDIIYCNTNGIVVGDKIALVKNGQKYETNYVLQIISGNELQLENNVEQSYNISQRAILQVLRNSYTNYHEHQIRENSIETLIVSEYLSLGYNSTHSHLVIPCVNNISSIGVRTNEILIGGSSSTIFKSIDGEQWIRLSDMNNFETTDITAITDITMYNDLVLAGTSNGEIFYEISADSTIIPLEQPKLG